MYSSLFVSLMGVGTVFFGLTCIILLTTAMSAICIRSERRNAPAPQTAAAPAAETAPADKAALIAAVSAVIAEEMGTSVSGIRILSMKKI
ncbi:MAG: OadG family protein [Oscillospiraceae bacterium]